MRIWRVKPPTPVDDDGSDDMMMDGGDGTWSASIVGDFDDHK